MGFAIVRENGDLEFTDWHPGLTNLEKHLGPDGFASVVCNFAPDMRGYVSDVGLLRPTDYPRNRVGTCMLIALGAGVQPYAGPVVLTGFTRLPEPDATDLTARHQTLLRDLHASTSLVLGGGRSTYGADWDTAVREYADQATHAEVPPVIVRGFTGELP